MIKILVVDDDKHLTDALSEVLSDKGFDVDVERTVSAGIDAASSGDYELLICDWDLGPGACGMDVIQAAHGDTWTCLFSGLDHDQEIEKGVTEGRWHTRPGHSMTKENLPELVAWVQWRLS